MTSDLPTNTEGRAPSSTLLQWGDRPRWSFDPADWSRGGFDPLTAGLWDQLDVSPGLASDLSDCGIAPNGVDTVVVSPRTLEVVLGQAWVQDLGTRYGGADATPQGLNVTMVRRLNLTLGNAGQDDEDVTVVLVSGDELGWLVGEVEGMQEHLEPLAYDGDFDMRGGYEDDLQLLRRDLRVLRTAERC